MVKKAKVTKAGPVNRKCPPKPKSTTQQKKSRKKEFRERTS